MGGGGFFAPFVHVDRGGGGGGWRVSTFVHPGGGGGSLDVHGDRKLKENIEETC